MELVVKLPKGKLPFIGIIFDREYEAGHTNEDIFNDYRNCIYRIVIEPHKNTLSLSLLRMPLLFATKEQEQAWLNPKATKEDIEKMMLPLDEKYMGAYTINKNMTSTKPAEYPELAFFD